MELWRLVVTVTGGAALLECGCAGVVGISRHGGEHNYRTFYQQIQIVDVTYILLHLSSLITYDCIPLLVVDLPYSLF